MQIELWKQNKISKFSRLAMYCPENICFKRHLRKKSTDSVRRDVHNYKWFTVNVLEIVKICRDLWSNLWDDCLITGATFILDDLVHRGCVSDSNSQGLEWAEGRTDEPYCQCDTPPLCFIVWCTFTFQHYLRDEPFLQCMFTILYVLCCYVKGGLAIIMMFFCISLTPKYPKC